MLCLRGSAPDPAGSHLQLGNVGLHPCRGPHTIIAGPETPWSATVGNWCNKSNRPLYKIKGDINDPGNYRGITLLSCIGKLFTSVINERLTVFIDSNQIMSEAHAGFRKDYSTTDQIFTLKRIVELFLCQGRRLFCIFVDYSKVFDSTNRATLWKKLI